MNMRQKPDDQQCNESFEMKSHSGVQWTIDADCYLAVLIEREMEKKYKQNN